MSDLVITSTAEASQADIEAVKQGLRAFNEVHAGPMNWKDVRLIARDAGGVIRAGLLGRQQWGWLYVEILWVDEACRRSGWGTRLLQQAEEEGRSAGCSKAMLDTFEFQALPFYQRHGYSVFGVLEDFPPGYRRYYMQKRLM